MGCRPTVESLDVKCLLSKHEGLNPNPNTHDEVGPGGNT